MFTEFAALLAHNREEIVALIGGLLRVFAAKTGAPAIPTLMKHFDAIIVNDIPETYPGRLHPDDPVIDLRSGTIHTINEIALAVETAIEAKYKKGPSYTADLLVLHTIKADHKPYVPSTGMHTQYIVPVGEILAPKLRGRFKQIWFLNAYQTPEGKRLYRLA